MKLARFTADGHTATGAMRGYRVVELASVLPEAPSTIRDLLEASPALLRRIEVAPNLAPFGHALAAVRLEAPIPDASKYLAIGMNYQDHAEEARRVGVPIPKTQLWFNKQVSCINGPFDAVLIPRVSDKVDYEIELGVVIDQLGHIENRFVSEAASSP